MQKTITIDEIDYNLLKGQNDELLKQNKDLQEQLLREKICCNAVLKAYCTIISDIIKYEKELPDYFFESEEKNER